MRLKRCIQYIFGMLIMTLGSCLMINSDLGAGSYDALSVGLYRTFGMSTGSWSMVIGIVFVVVDALLMKARPNFLALVTSIMTGVGVDFWLFVLKIPQFHMTMRIILLCMGIAVHTLGVVVYTNANIANGPSDQFMLIIGGLCGNNLFVGKIVLEVTFILLALVFHGPVAFGTFAIAVLASWFIQTYNHLLFQRRCRPSS